MNSAKDKSLIFASNKPVKKRHVTKPRSWLVLIVDDDEQVHEATEYALLDVTILGRQLELLHAYSAREARNILESSTGIAVVFLDVVMENESAGLDLVKVIRTELGLKDLRIILRTGQPGYAPELEAIRDYDINDYRTKAELTRTRLITSLISAIRSYEQIHTINCSRQGLTKIVHAASDLFERHGLESMAEGVLLQLAGLMQLSPNGLVCAQRGYPLDDTDPDRLYIVGAVGRYAEAMNLPLEKLGNPQIEQAIRKAIMARSSQYYPEYSVLYLNSGNREEAVFMDSSNLPEPLDIQLLEVFAANISVGFANVYLFNKLNYLAYHDTLTGLPNRASLHEQAKAILLGADKTDCTIALMLLDLDRFKDVNDTLGHHVGDLLLTQIGPRLRTALHGYNAIISRLGGDEFAILLNSTSGVDKAIHVAQQIREALLQPFDIQGMNLEIGASIGIACYPQHGEDSHALLRSSDVAMYQSKRNNIAVTVYDAKFDTHTPERLALMTDLGQAIRTGQLTLHYQPKLDLNSNQIIGLEALVRWNHPRLGLLMPDLFIPIAEMSDFIHSLTLAVLECALEDLTKLKSIGRMLPVSVNLSARNLIDIRCFTEMQKLLKQTAIPHEYIELELTETALMHDPESAAKLLQKIADSGIRLIVDDFGTGYSSLAYLRRLPLSALKIDRSFVRDMVDDNQDAVIVRSTISLAHNLGLKVTAEGVENEQTLQMLRDMGCDEIQGYYLCAPQPIDKVIAWLQQR